MYDEKCYGVCPLVGRPILLVKDPSLVRQIYVKDFNHFVDREGIQYIYFLFDLPLVATYKIL